MESKIYLIIKLNKWNHLQIIEFDFEKGYPRISTSHNSNAPSDLGFDIATVVPALKS